MGGNHTIMRRVTPYVRPAAWRRVASVIVLLMSAAAAHATSPARGSIHTYAALRGKFAFVPPDGGLTVLDSATGKVLFRGPARSDERYSWNSFFDTPHGLVVRSYRWKLLTRDESVYRLLDFKTQGQTWEVASLHDCHVGEDFLVCPDWLGRLVARRLADGKELWSHRPDRPTGEVLDSKGRVMIAGHEQDIRWRDRADGTRVLDSRDRIRSLVILDGGTGRELMAARGLDVAVAADSYGTSAYSFDGAHVVVDTISWDGACGGRLHRAFEPDTAGTGLTAEERCAPAHPPAERSAAFERIAKALPGLDAALAEAEGRVFVDRTFSAGGRGALECVDAETGKGLWSYLFDAPAPGPFF
jgi:outer membrane protein assembly factor BamB